MFSFFKRLINELLQIVTQKGSIRQESLVSFFGQCLNCCHLVLQKSSTSADKKTTLSDSR